MTLTSLSMLEHVAECLGDLLTQVGFTGGSVVALYVDDFSASEIRLTEDVDIVVEVVTLREYYETEAKLRTLGWKQPVREGDPICRWVTPGGVLVDVMPQDVTPLGFSNAWYPAGMSGREAQALPNGREIDLFPVGLFIASKIDAFRNRGQGDWYASHDDEDIVTVVEGRESIVADVSTEPVDVRAHIAEWVAELLRHPSADEVVEGHMPRVAVRGGRIALVLGRLDKLAAGRF